MKKIVVFLILISSCFSLPVFGQEQRIEIFGSVLGAMADPARWSFSCIHPDGSLNAEKYQDFMSTFRKYGATATRELPFLVHDDKRTVTPNYMPYVYENGKYNLDKFNDQYFKNLAEMARIANGQGIVFYFSLFDQGGHGNFPNSPWRLNHQNVDGWLDPGNKAKYYRSQWVWKVLDTLQSPYVVGYELANEPNHENFPAIAADTMRQLRRNKVPYWRILMGAEFIRSDRIPGNKLYRQTKKVLKTMKEWDKRELFSKVVHGADVWFFQKYWHVQKHWARPFFSDDGMKPKRSAAWWENVLTPYFKAVKKKKNKFLKTRAGFEHVCRFYNDDIYGCYGIAKALENAYGIKMYKQAPPLSHTKAAAMGVDAFYSDTAEGFTIKKRKWYEYVLIFFKAIYEALFQEE